MPQAACFTREQILDYSLGRVSVEEERLIAEHLEQCPDCQEAASQCDHSADSLVAALREPQEASSLDDAFCREALARAVRHAPGASLDRTEPIRIREYELIRKLGEGGMGTVYQARHTRLGKIVALKILPPDRMRDPSAVARFEREMLAVGSLDDPAIVRATDAGDVDGTHFLVMEYVEGFDLGTLAERTGPLPIAEACELVRQAAVGLQHVHERGMVHRDVKPSNLMLTPRGEVKILDLGLALLQGSDGDAQEVTTVGRFMGTLDYMAPEQADDSHEVDIRADVYGLGATLYRLICGVPPFAGKEYRSPLKKLKALAVEPVPPVRERRPDVPAPLAQIIERMLAKDPADRFATPAEVAQALAPLAAGSNPAELVGRVSNLPEQSVPQAPSKPASRARRFRFSLATMLLALVGLLAAAAIYVETDKGTLVIKSPDPGIEVLIRRSGEPVDDWELQRGENRTTVRSGSYEIVLIGETDALRVKDGTFTLTRGGDHVATIERVETEDREDASETPWFGGMGGGWGPGMGGGMSVIPIPVPATGESGFGGGLGSDGAGRPPGTAQFPGTKVTGGVASSSDAKALQGVWEAKGLQDGGRTAPVEVTRMLRLVFDENRFQVWRGERIKTQGTYEIDPTVDPKAITFFDRGIETPRRGIYRLQDSKLWIVLNETPGGEHPTAFVSERGSPNDTLMELHRTQPPPPDRPTSEDAKTTAAPPTYGGKTFREWATVLQSERSADRIVEALLALQALAEGEQTGEAAEHVFEKVKQYSQPWVFGGSPEGRIRNAAVYALQQVGSESTVELLSQRLETGTSRERAYALYALARHPVSFVTGPNESVSSTVIDASVARAALPAILVASSDPDPDVRTVALTLAAELAPENKAVLARLQEALRDPQMMVAYTAADLLAELDPTAKGLVDAMFRILRSEPKGTPISRLDKARIAYELAKVAPDAERLVAELIKLVEQEPTVPADWSARGPALRALKRLGPKAAPAVPALERLIESPESLSHYWPMRGFAGPEFQIASSESRTITQLAVDALGAVGPKAAEPRVIEALQRLRWGPSVGNRLRPPEVAKAAADALQKIRPSQSAESLGLYVVPRLPPQFAS